MSESESSKPTQPADIGLRWARYDGVYYVAMAMPSESVPVDVPAGSQFVYFLDGEAGCIVHDADVEPYDPNDAAKAGHPAAAAGVQMAHELLYGAGASAGAAAAGGLEHELEGESTYLDMLTRDDGKDKSEKKAKKEKKEKKKDTKVKKEKEKEKEKSKRRREYDSDDDDDDDDASDSGEDLLLGGARGAGKGRGAGTDSDTTSDTDSASTTRSGSGSASEAGHDRAATRANAKKEAERWSGLARDYGFDDDDDDASDAAATRTAAHPRAREGMSGALSALVSRSTAVAALLPMVQHAYRTARQEAESAGGLVTAYERDVVRAVEHRLRLVQAEMRALQQALDTPASTAVADAEQRRRGTRAALARLQKGGEAVVGVEAITRSLVRLRTAPGRRDGDDERRRRRLGRSSATSFCEPALALTLREAASRAEPRDPTAEAAPRYREQRLRREQVLHARRTREDGGGERHAPLSGAAGAHQSFLDMWYDQYMHTQSPSPTMAGSRVHPTLSGVSEEGMRARTHTAGSAGVPTWGPAAPVAVEDTLTLFHGTAGAGQRMRAGGLTPALYRFDALVLSGDGGEEGVGGSPGGVSGAHELFDGLTATSPAAARAAAEAAAGPVASLQLPFDHRAVFALDPTTESLARAATAAAASETSALVSASYALPSQESMWYGEDGSVDGGGGGTAAPARRGGSVAYSADSRADSRGRPSGAGAGDWRSKAKRVVAETLTLYLKGLRGRPRLLPEDAFEPTGRLLLERAVEAEARRQGISLALRRNNLTAPFTNEVARMIKKSVENYVHRHFGPDSSVGRTGAAVEPGDDVVRDAQREESVGARATAGTAADEDLTYQT